MFINLYSNLMINYDNNTHLIFNNEADFIQHINSYLVESITSEDAMNYLPNNKEFLIKLSNMNQATSITYILWYTNNAYKHFKVLNYKLYKDYVIYTCLSDLWADATYNSAFALSLLQLTRSNMSYTKNENDIPYFYDTINYTNRRHFQANLTVSGAGNIQNNTPSLIVAFDRQVDSWSVQSLFFGATWESVIAYVPYNESDVKQFIPKLISTAGGDKIRVKALYKLPFTPASSENLEVFYKGQPQDTHVYVRPLTIGVYFTTKLLYPTAYNNGQNKVYVGAGDSMMLLENITPYAEIVYKFIIDNYSITAYVCQGDNTKDITDAYIMRITSNDATLSLQESLAKITGAGFKTVSGALMLKSPATAVGGITSIAGAGIDLLPSSKPASYTIDGNAESTYLDGSSGFNYRIYEAINNMLDITMLYGVNYNWYASFNEIINGTLLNANYRRYIKCNVLSLSSMNNEEYNFIKSELERGIYILAPTE